MKNDEWRMMKDEQWRMMITSCWGVLITYRQTSVNVELICYWKPHIIYSLTPSTKWIISSRVESDVIHSSRSLTMSKQMSHKRSLGLLSSLAGILVADARTVVKAKIVKNIFQGLCWDEKSADEWCFICNSYQSVPCHMFQSSFSLMLCAHLCHLSLYKTCHQGNTF